MSRSFAVSAVVAFVFIWAPVSPAANGAFEIQNNTLSFPDGSQLSTAPAGIVTVLSFDSAAPMTPLTIPGGGIST